MKVNIISDIHATMNSKTGEIVYNLPFKHSRQKYLDFFNALYSDWKSVDDKFKNSLEFKYSSINTYFSETIVLKTVEDIDSYFNELKAAVEANFAGIGRDKMFYFTRGMNNLQQLYRNVGHNPLPKNNNVNYSQFIDFIFKTCYDFYPEKLESADYLIIAGDLGLDNFYDEVLADIESKTKGKFKKILHIAGNHDHWWIGSEGLKGKTRPEDVNLEHDYNEHVDGDYVFLGCTLWTPISESAVWRIGRYMNDYRYIPGRFTCYRSNHQYKLQSKWIKDKLEQYKDKKVIVFTHHQPFEELVADDYKHNGKGWDGEDVNEAYVVMDHSLDDINKFGNIKLWACGHTHQNFDGILHDVHVVRNPIGYRDHYGYCPAENATDTWYNKIIEL